MTRSYQALTIEKLSALLERTAFVPLNASPLFDVSIGLILTVPSKLIFRLQVWAR